MEDSKVLKPAVKRRPPAAGMGRKKGSVNKVTREFRETVNRLLESNADNVLIWLDQVATGSHGQRPDPGRALDLMAKLAEYVAPKLSRTEVSGPDGAPIQSSLDVSGLSTDVLAEIMKAKDAANRG